MAFASYERQHLALYAAGHIDLLPDSPTTASAVSFGCQLTRLGVGVFAILFGNDDGLVDGESYTFVTPKFRAGFSGYPFYPGPSVPFNPNANVVSVSVEDTSNTVKTIFCFGVTITPAPGVTLVSADPHGLEIAVFRTVTPT